MKIASQNGETDWDIEISDVSKRDCRIWGSENPNAIIEKPMHPQQVTVWCEF